MANPHRPRVRRYRRETAFLAFWRTLCPHLPQGEARKLFQVATVLG